MGETKEGEATTCVRERGKGNDDVGGKEWKGEKVMG